MGITEKYFERRRDYLYFIVLSRIFRMRHLVAKVSVGIEICKVATKSPRDQIAP